MPEQDEFDVDVDEQSDGIAFSEFLEKIPPSNFTKISVLTERTKTPSGFKQCLIKPEIQLNCADDDCNGTRFYRCGTMQNINVSDATFTFCYITYLCSNCRRNKKTYSLAVQRDEKTESGQCYKFGEMPVYGPPTPARLIKLIGPDRELFLKGRRCENQGLGIGAFVYYRRVVEHQKNRILREIIKVSKKLNVDDSIIAALESAKAETQFKKALGSVKDAIPQVLLINGYNPLTLLHSALSEGVHERSDERCLEIASSVRVVLGELSERLAQALKDEAELQSALARLLEGNK